MASVLVGNPGDMGVNTLYCRWGTLNTTLSAASMCRYLGLSGGGRCGGMINNVCQIATSPTVCQNQSTASYADIAPCVTGLAPKIAQWGSLQGPSGASEDSLECRLYHAVNWLSSGDVSHCGHFGVTGGPCGGLVSTNQQHYCENAQYFCNSTGPYAQYADISNCLVIAAGMPLNASTNNAIAANAGNNLGCRQYHITAAAAGAGLQHCGHGGPSGGQGVCGIVRDAWATNLAAAPCQDGSVLALTMAVASTVIDAAIPPGITGAQNYSTTFDTTMNTQVCRLYHLTVAAVQPSAHCSHGWISGGDACGTRGANLCAYIQAICGFGANASYQFASMAACTAGFSTFNATLNGLDNATSGNTYGCRFYHAGVAASYLAGSANGNSANAMATAVLHCGHVLAPFTTVGGCNPGGGSSPTVPTAAPGSSPAAIVSASLAFAAALLSTLFL